MAPVTSAPELFQASGTGRKIGPDAERALPPAPASFMRRNRNRTPMWWDKEVPSGWGDVGGPGLVDRTVNFLYKKIQYYSSSFSLNSGRQQALQASVHSYIKHSGKAAEPQLPEAAE